MQDEYSKWLQIYKQLYVDVGQTVLLFQNDGKKFFSHLVTGDKT